MCDQNEEEELKKEIPLSRANRIINHGPVVFVTSQVGEERPNIVTVAWSMPVTQKPPLVAISLGKSRYSHRLISEGKAFVVNVPTSAMAPAIMFCGKVSGKAADKFLEARLTAVPAKEVVPPLIDECIGHLECQVEQCVDVGDHSLFIGRVVVAWVEEDLFDETWKTDRERGEGIHHLGGNVFSVSKERLVVRV